MDEIELLILGLGVGALPFVGYLVLRNSLWVLVFLLLSRFVVDSAPELAYVSIVRGFSVARVYSAAIMVFLMFYLWFRQGFFADTYRIQVGVFFFVSIMSALYNFEWPGVFDTTIKWLYLWLTLNLVVLASKENDEHTLLRAMSVVFLYPLLNQVVFAIIGTPKVGGGQTSYLGSFFHEVSFAYILLMGITVFFAVLVSDRSKVWRSLGAILVVWGHVALYLNNYRTAIMALGVWWLFVVMFWVPKLRLGQRLLVVVTLMFAISLIVLVLGEDLAGKMGDAFDVVSQPEEYLDFSGQARQTKVLSGRVYLWNTYIYEFLKAPWATKVFGHGPEAGISVVGIHAHNQFLTTLLDVGLMGLGAMIFFVLTILYSTIRKIRRGTPVLVCMGGMVIGVFFMMLATSPVRETRAMLLIGVALGFIAAQRQRMEVGQRVGGGNVRRSEAAKLRSDKRKV